MSDIHQLIAKLSPNKKVILVDRDWRVALVWAIGQVHPDLISKLIIINGVPLNSFLKALQNSPQQREQSKYVGGLDGWLSTLMFAVWGSDLIWKGVA